MKTVIVIPHHLPTLAFLSEWHDEFARDDVELIIVEDKPKRVTTLDGADGLNLTVYTHQDIDHDLGKKSWIIPRGSSAVRSYGLYKAWQTHADMIVTLDNDCYPERKQYFIDGHWQALTQRATLDWVKTADIYTRGFPYLIRETSTVAVNHGLWSNVPDLDAATSLHNPSLRFDPCHQSQVIARHNFYPMCGMNLAFRPEFTPLLYFGLQGPAYGIDQYDDIWAGVFSKKVLDHLGFAVRSGAPSVEHRKQSNVFVNFQKQAGGIAFNETLWRDVAAIELTEKTPAAAMAELMHHLPTPNDYFAKVKEATLLWLSLFTG